jgi:hypothetical protein
VLRPTAGELLEGVSAGLRRSVLPALPPGDAERQLKAALHVLDRLRRSWDLLPPYLESDNADMRDTLTGIVASVAGRHGALPSSVASLASGFAPRPDQSTPVRGVNARSLAWAAMMNDELQARVVTLARWLAEPAQLEDLGLDGQRETLRRLYRRMTERALEAWGTPREPD